MGRVRWSVFAAGWLAVLGAGFLAPWTFIGLLGLGSAVAAIPALGTAPIGVGPPGPSRALGWVCLWFGAVGVPVAALVTGIKFVKPGVAQAAGLRQFSSVGDAIGTALGDPWVLGIAAGGSVALAAGWRLALGVSAGQAVAGGGLCLAAYPAIVLALYGVA